MEQMSIFEIEAEEVVVETMPRGLTPRQWALYRLIKENTLKGKKTTQREICDKIEGYTWVEKDGSNHDHCSQIWQDIYGENGINFHPHIQKIIDGTNFEYFLCDEEEANRFADSLWKQLSPRLRRYWATVAKIKKDGQYQLFDCEGKEITDDSTARGYVESFLNHPKISS